MRKPDTSDLVVAALVSLGLAVLTLYPAGSVRVGSRTQDIRLGDFFGFRYFLMLLCAVFIAVAAIEIIGVGRTAVVAAAGFGFLAVVTTAWIITVEGAARLIPASILPTAVRRFTLGLGASFSAWLMLLLCLVALLACLGLLRPGIEKLLHPEANSTLTLVRWVSLAAVTSGVVLVGLGRVNPLATVDLQVERIDVEPWAISYLGPGLLLAFLVMLITGALVAVRWRPADAALAGAGVAWITATIAGLLYATSAVLVDTPLIEWASERIGRDDLLVDEIARGPAPLLLFVGSVIAGLGYSAQVAVSRDDDG